MFLALKEMKKEKRRFLLIISIFALISYLVCFLTSLAYGLAIDNRTAADQWKTKRIVLAKGSNNSISSSMVDEDAFVKDLSDVDYEFINLSRSAAYINGDESEESTVNLVLIGMNPDSKRFPKIIEGKNISDSKDVIASRALRDEKGMKIGDELKLSMNDSVFKIVGFTDDYKFNVAPVIYTKLEAAAASAMIYKPKNIESAEGKPDAVSQATANPPKRVSAALVYSDKGLGSLSDSYDVVDIAKFIKEIPGYYAQLLTFGLMIGFLIVIASIVLGVFLYIITIQKNQTFGIMKIQGISNSYIGNSVVIQTFLISLAGIAIGLGLTYATEFFLPDKVPFRSDVMFYAVISAVMMITAQIGAIFSVKSVSKVDPLTVI